MPIASLPEQLITFHARRLERAKTNPVVQDNDYDSDRYAAVLKLVKENKIGRSQQRM